MSEKQPSKEELDKLHEEALELDNKATELLKIEQVYSPQEVVDKIILEQQLQEQRKALEDVALAFGVDYRAFSDEDDVKFAQQFKKSIERFWTRVEREPVDILKFHMPGTGNVYEYPGWGRAYDLTIPAEYVGDLGGRMIPSDVENFNELTGPIEIQRALILTKKEIQAFKYYTDAGATGSFHRVPRLPKPIYYQLPIIEEKLKWLEVKRRALSDDKILSFLKWKEAKKSSIPLKYVIYMYCHDNSVDYETFKEKFNGLLENQENYKKISKLDERLLARIGKIYMTRLPYISKAALSGSDPRFKFESKADKQYDEGCQPNIPSGARANLKTYSVSDNYEFTEEDARKAIELDLPWSKM